MALSSLIFIIRQIHGDGGGNATNTARASERASNSTKRSLFIRENVKNELKALGAMEDRPRRLLNHTRDTMNAVVAYAAAAKSEKSLRILSHFAWETQEYSNFRAVKKIGQVK